MYEYKLNLWDFRDGQKKPISLSDWRIMNAQICTAAVLKLKNQGPPCGGVGQKHWQEHSDGTIKTSKLSDSERFGHVVIRFSTLEAQNWYDAITSTVLGTAQDGKKIQITSEIEAKDGRARYVFSVQEADFTAFGSTHEEREDTLKLLIFSGSGLANSKSSKEDLDAINAKTSIYSSFVFQEKNRQEKNRQREDLRKMGMKFPFEYETQLDTILQGENFGVLSTSITPVRVLKKEDSKEKKNAEGGSSSGGDGKDDQSVPKYKF